MPCEVVTLVRILSSWLDVYNSAAKFVEDSKSINVDQEMSGMELTDEPNGRDLFSSELEYHSVKYCAWRVQVHNQIKYSPY